MDVLFALVAVIAIVLRLDVLAVVAGVLAIGNDALGFFSGALRGCATSIVTYLVAGTVGLAFLPQLGMSGAAGLLAGIAIGDGLWGVGPLVIMGVVALGKPSEPAKPATGSQHKADTVAGGSGTDQSSEDSFDSWKT